MLVINFALGKGFGGALIIDYAIKNSVFIKENPNVKIAKITGRLKILNLKILLQQVLHTKKDETVYADTNWKLTFVYSYFYVANVNFLSNFFLSNKIEINDTKGVYFEHVLQNAIKKYKKKGFNFKCFKKTILIDGVSASTGTTFIKKSNLVADIKQFLKFLINNLF